MQHSLRIALFVLGALAVLAPAGPAFSQTKRRIAVLDIEDAPNAALTKDLVKVLRGRHTVISSKTFSKAAKRLRAESMTSENLALVASEIRADGVLSGSVTEARGRYVLRLHLRSGRTGKTVQKLRLRLGRARLSKRMRSQLRQQLGVGISQLRPVEERGGPDEDFGDDEEIEVVVGPKADGADPADDQPGAPADAQTEGAAAAAASVTSSSASSPRDRDPDQPMTEPRRAARVSLGASAVKRDLVFDLAEPFPEAPNGYAGPMAPGVRVSGDFYPLQLTGLADTIAAILGVAFHYDRVVGLQTAVDTGGQEIIAATAQSDYSVGVRLRYRFASLPLKPTLTLGVGQGKLSFIVDDAQLPPGLALDVPNTTYSYRDPGLWIGLQLHPRVHLQTGARVLLMYDAGQMQDPDQYGRASILSFQADAAAEFALTRNWRVAAQGSYTAVQIEFVGDGEQTYLRDGDPGDIDVLGASDTYLGGALTLGYVY